MQATAVLYLGHMNPFTNAHEAIISKLAEQYQVYVLPVRFLKNGLEVNTRSFPFSYELRREMIESVFGDSVMVLPDYCFHSPFQSYLPPVLSPRSWELRRHIISKINEKKLVSYTGDSVERLMLRVYRLNPLKGKRLPISASSVKEMLYRDSHDHKDGKWRSLVPKTVEALIDQNWTVVEKFSKARDDTKKVMGMKFPLDGYRNQ